MPSYAAIKLIRENMFTILESVAEYPAGKDRLSWAMFRYPSVPGEAYYFVRGNYRKVQQLDFTKQILSQTELDLLFTYQERKRERLGRTNRNPDLNWFAVTPREQHPDMILDDEIPKAVLNEEGRHDHQRHRQEAGHVAQGNSRSGKRR